MTAPVRVHWPESVDAIALPEADGAGSLAERFARAGHPLNTRCGGRGRCAGCTIDLTTGEFVTGAGAIVAAPASIQACQGDLRPDVAAELRVPARAAAVHRPQIVSTFKLGVPSAHEPRFPVAGLERDHGLAIDLGTTTVVVSLVDLHSGLIVGEQAGLNRQVEFGDDVATRIHAAATRLAELHDAIAHRTLDRLIGTLSARSGVPTRRIAGAVVAGNTTMLHLLTATDPSPLGVAPFTPAFLDAADATAATLGLRSLRPDTPVHLLPGFSAYVGADLVAGAACTGLLNEPGPCLLVDIGTNGEILLQHEGRIRATATAAGPAFEGGRMRCGTRAIAGAIAHVRFAAGLPVVDVIPGAREIAGICGSGCIDLLAEGRRQGLLTATGRFNDAVWPQLPAAHRAELGGIRAVRLVADSSASLVTEADLAELLQAKAAIAAGMLTLLQGAGLSPRDVTTIHLAGGFGLHVDVANAIACGLLPGFAPPQVEVVGNTSLGGAWLALTDRTTDDDIAQARASAEIVALNLVPGFEDTFIDQLRLP